MLGLGIALGLGVATFPVEAQAHGEPHLYESVIEGVRPAGASARIEFRIIDFDSQVQLTNRSGRTVVVEGYEGEPYLRIDGDGRVFLNARSPSMAPSNDRLGRTRRTGHEDADARPNWIRVADGGSFTWFDRRTHYRRRGRPSAVTDEAERTRLWRWRIPFTVGERSAAVEGSLYWLGRRPFPTGLFLFLLLSTAGASLFGAWAIRRMRETGRVEDGSVREGSNPEHPGDPA